MGRARMSLRITTVLAACALTCCTSMSASAQSSADKIVSWIDDELPSLIGIYQSLHRSPEVTWQENATAATIADAWQSDGFSVTRGVGKIGVVAIMTNGEGPTVMIRCDMDALPVTEITQLPYSSENDGVMHACGHDVHMTNAIGVARYMSLHRSDWSGTLMMIAQPAEEKGEGAKAMLADGLFDRFPKPDYALALHVAGDKPAGSVAVLAGYSQANVDSVDIIVNGRGGHGAKPETTIDPIVQAADLVMALQTIVSREIAPIDPAVITVGAINGGTKHNIIGDTCHLQLTVRTYSDEVRKKVLDAIRRKAEAIAQSYGAPSPGLTFSDGTPSLQNDAELAARMRSVFADVLGQQNIVPNTPSMGGEDFSRYGRAGVPILMYSVGSVDPQRLARFEALRVPPPSLHSGAYYPDIEPTLRTAVLTMTSAALELLPPPSTE